ncbi:Glutamate receptor ionotropic, kainate 2 [Nymphon striatum]|nr:Glutamate receptor ionotropic, kainate 2 [Nymphon striatum]
MSTIQANLARNKILNSLNENQLNTYFLAKNFTANSELTQNEIIRVIQCIMEGAMHNYRYKSILLLLQVIPIWCYYMILHIQRMENITIIKLFYSLDNTSSADLAMGDLTITYEREQAVDFTMPFMNLGIGILFSKPSESVPSLFSFLSPLSWDVWLYMLTSYLGISVFLFLVARFSPYEWQCPHPCNQNSEILENQFTLMNSLWFIVGSLMQQGSDLAPKAWSTRMVAGTWWFFTLIMISSYTANLAAFLTVQRMVSPIESAEDLVQQTKIKYGCYGGGSTEAFFREFSKLASSIFGAESTQKIHFTCCYIYNSQMETYRRMWAFMESARPSVFVTSGKLGIKKAMKGDYAYLMESTSIEYVTQRTCNLTQIGGLLDSKGYGIATQQGSPYRQLISGAILQLQEETMLDVLKIRWWRQKRGGAKCNKEDSKKGSTGTANELSLANVGGVFVVLLCGTGFAFIIAFIEFLWKTQRNKEDGRVNNFNLSLTTFLSLKLNNQDSLCAEMLKELKFAVSCESSVRHVPKKNDFNAPESSYNFVTFTSFPSMSSKEPLS